MQKPKYAICVKPSARYLVCKGNKIWVKDRTCDYYVGIMQRGMWDTMDEAKSHIEDPVLEIVAEVFE